MADYNQNRNSFNAFRTHNTSYFQHSNIPDFSLTGENEFTLEIHMYYRSALTRSTLYGQVGIFEIGIDNGGIFLSAPGFCSFNSLEQNINLVPDSFNYIALTYNGEILSLFLQGYRVAEYKLIGTEQMVEDPYVIGKGTMGYLCTIRAFSEAHTDAQILKDHVNDLTEIASCVTWIDLGSAQPLDKGKNALPISLIGSDAKVVNLVPCSSFRGQGCATLKNKLPENLENFTVMGKIYPNFTSNTEMCIYSSINEAGEGYELFLRKLENHKYKLVFAGKEVELSSTKEIDATRWFDFAVTYAEKNLQIFIDGGPSGEATNNTLQLKGADYPIIGASIKNEKINYKRGFDGYMDYIAEFRISLPLDRIENYIDHPPFIFDKDMLSVMSLNTPKPSELAYDDPIFVSGDFRFILAEETCPLEAAKGVEYYYPTEEDPEWNGLHEEDKWKLEYYCTYINVLIYGALGLEIKPPTTKKLGLHMTGTRQFAQRGVLEMSSIYEMVPTSVDLAADTATALNSGNVSNLNTTSSGNGGFRTPSGSGMTAVTGGCFAVSSAAAGAAGSSAAVAVIAGIAGALIFGGLIGGITKLILYYTKRPEPENPKLTILSLKINNDGDPSKGSIHCRRNATESIPVKFDKISGKVNMKGVLIPTLVGKILLSIEVKNDSDVLFDGILTGTESGDRIFGSADLGAFTLAPKQTKTLTITINVAAKDWKLKSIMRKLTGNWSWRANEEFVLNTSHEIYTILDIPRTPWINTIPYSDLEIHYVWTELLDVCAYAYNKYGNREANHDVNSHLAAYATNLNEGERFEYDRNGGRTQYLDTGSTFKLHKYLNDNKEGTVHKLNCTDCAHIVIIAGIATGIECCIGQIQNTINYDGIELNQIIGIGSTSWGSPFDRPGSASFSYHDISFAGGLCLNKNSLLFDACLKIDGGNKPGQDYTDTQSNIKKETLPTSYEYSETELSCAVNVPTTESYTLKFYRQRLVKNGCHCNFLRGRDIIGISTTISRTLDLSTMISVYEPYIKALKERLHLEKNPIPHFLIDNFEKRELAFAPIETLGKWKLSEDLEREKVWNVLAGDNTYQIVSFESRSSEESYSVLLHFLTNITYPEIKRSDLADISFAVNDTLVIFAKKNFVIQIMGKNCLDYAKNMIELI